jgi:predicted PurR-regulated permease PerM
MDSTVDTAVRTPGSPNAPEPEPLALSAARARRAWRQLGLRLTSITPSGLARFLLVAGALTAIVLIIRNAWAALLPFEIGVVVAYLLLPLVGRIERHMPRPAAILVTFAGSLLLIVAAVAVVVPMLIDQVLSFALSVPDTLNAAGARVDATLQSLPPEQEAIVRDAATRIGTTVRENFLTYFQTAMSVLMSTFFSLLNFLAFLVGFLVVPFWLWYVLIDQAKGKRAVDRLLAPWLRADFWAVVRIADRVFSNYVRGQLILGAFIGAAVYLGYLLLQALGVQGIRFPLVLAVMAGAFEFIPYFGPILSAIPAVLIGLVHSWQTAVIIGLMYFVVQQLENNVLVPRITGNALEIHPAMLTVVMIALAPLGFIWLILAAPLAALARDEFLYVYGRFGDPPRPAGLLPGEPWPAPADTLPEASVPPAPPEGLPAVTPAATPAASDAATLGRVESPAAAGTGIAHREVDGATSV